MRNVPDSEDREDVPRRLELNLDDIIVHSKEEDGTINSDRALFYISTLTGPSSATEDLLIDAKEIVSDSPQWRYFVKKLEILDNIQKENIGSKIEYIASSINKKTLYTVFKEWCSGETVSQKPDVIHDCLDAFADFHEIFLVTLRDIGFGLDPQTIMQKNKEKNLKVVMGGSDEESRIKNPIRQKSAFVS